MLETGPFRCAWRDGQVTCQKKMYSLIGSQRQLLGEKEVTPFLTWGVSGASFRIDNHQIAHCAFARVYF
jgi:hypothetical protein